MALPSSCPPRTITMTTKDSSFFAPVATWPPLRWLPSVLRVGNCNASASWRPCTFASATPSPSPTGPVSLGRQVWQQPVMSGLTLVSTCPTAECHGTNTPSRRSSWKVTFTEAEKNLGTVLTALLSQSA